MDKRRGELLSLHRLNINTFANQKEMCGLERKTLTHKHESRPNFRPPESILSKRERETEAELDKEIPAYNSRFWKWRQEDPWN